MIKEFTKLRKKLTAAHLLAVTFLVYILYVSQAALPEFLYNLGGAFYWDTGYKHFIETVDTQYESMLLTDPNQPLLRDKGTYINLNGLMAKQLRQPVMNERLLMKNGHLGYIPAEAPDREFIREAAEVVIRFHNAHTAGGGNFLFVMTPTQNSKYEEYLPEGYTDSVNGPADTFLSFLEEAGVPYLDLREELQNDGISVTDAYYVTDHHWIPEIGFWAYGEILNKLEQMDIIDPVDPFYTDAGNYRFETYENTFLGSSGRRTGIYYAGLDDSTYIYPNFETDISVSIPSMEVECRGPFEEVAYHQQQEYDLEDPDYFNTNFYAMYGWGDTAITHWRNEQAPDQSKFLLIGESFGNIPFSLMSISLGVMDELDVRYFEEDFSDYYHGYNPDTVILEFNAGAILSEFTDYHYLG